MAFLLHGILDYVVDTHFEAIQQLDAEVDQLEDRLFDDVTSDAALQRTHLRGAQEPGRGPPAGAADAGGPQHPHAA